MNAEIKIQSFSPEDDATKLVDALKQDGAVILKNLVKPELIDTVLSELRKPFDKLGRYDEDNFNGFKTLRVSGISQMRIARNLRKFVRTRKQVSGFGKFVLG